MTLFALLIIVVALSNLALGFASAGYLGWGPRCWDDIQLALMPAVRTPKDNEQPSKYSSDLDVQRLIDRASQRMRKLGSTESRIDDPCQALFTEVNANLDRLEIRLDCVHAKLLASQACDAPFDWQAIVESARMEFRESTEITVGLIEKWNGTLNEEHRERLGPFQIGLCEDFSRIVDSMPAIASRDHLDETDDEALKLWYHGACHDLNKTTWQMRSLMREILAEVRPAIEWDPQLLKDGATSRQTLTALEAERQLNPSAETTYFVARCRLDQEAYDVPKLGRLFFRFAAERLSEVLSPSVPAHWLVVPLGQGQWLVRGDADSLDEFAIVIDELRQRLASTELRLGGTTMRLTSSWVISDDIPEFETEQMLLALRQLLLDAQRYGENRTFLSEEGLPVPVLAEEIDVEPSTIEL